MSPAESVGVAVVFVWLGMVLAISFLETPLKFQAPGVTVPIGLGIGRLVFRALNAVELAFAVALAALAVIDPPSIAPILVLAVAAACLLLQLVAVRPRLGRRTAAVLSGVSGDRSGGHHAYVVLEVLKVLALIAGGILLLDH